MLACRLMTFLYQGDYILHYHSMDYHFWFCLNVCFAYFIQPNFSSIIEHCNLWRNYDDIQDSWKSLETIIDYYGDNQDVIIPNAGPGHWNDPDMVIFYLLKNNEVF